MTQTEKKTWLLHIYIHITPGDFFQTDTTKRVAFLLIRWHTFYFFGSEVTKPLLKNLHLLSLHFSRFQCLRCSTVNIFVAMSTVLQVWTLSDVLSLCCGRDFDHVIWGADKLWRYLTAYFLILKVYIKLYVRTTNIAHHIWIEIYRNLNMNLFFFLQSPSPLFFFFKHNKLLTRKLKKTVSLCLSSSNHRAALQLVLFNSYLNGFHLSNFLTSDCLFCNDRWLWNRKLAFW